MIASLEHHVKEVTQGLQAVDPAIIAEASFSFLLVIVTNFFSFFLMFFFINQMQASMFGAGMTRYEDVVAAYKVLNEKHKKLTREMEDLKRFVLNEHNCHHLIFY